MSIGNKYFTGISRMILSVLSVCAVSAGAPSPGSCTDMSHQIDLVAGQLKEMEQLRAELNVQFEDKVRRDLTSQAEGIVDELIRNSAIKLSYARKKLLRNMETKNTLLATNKRRYCEKCQGVFPNDFARQSYCDKCPESVECGG